MRASTDVKMLKSIKSSPPKASPAPSAAPNRNAITEGAAAAVVVAGTVKRDYRDTLAKHLAPEFQTTNGALLLQDYEYLAEILESIHTIIKGSSSIAEGGNRVGKGWTAISWIRTLDNANAQLEGNLAKLSESENLKRVYQPIRNLLAEYKALMIEATKVLDAGFQLAQQQSPLLKKAFHKLSEAATVNGEGKIALAVHALDLYSNRKEFFAMADEIKSSFPSPEKVRIHLVNTAYNLNVAIKAIWLAIDKMEIEMGFNEGAVVIEVNKMLNKKKQDASDEKLLAKEKDGEHKRVTTCAVNPTLTTTLASPVASTEIKVAPVSPDVKTTPKKLGDDKPKEMDIKKVLSGVNTFISQIGYEFPIEERIPYTGAILKQREALLETQAGYFTPQGLANILETYNYSDELPVREAILNLVKLYKIDEKRVAAFSKVFEGEDVDAEQDSKVESAINAVIAELKKNPPYKDEKRESVENGRIALMTKRVKSAREQLKAENDEQSRNSIATRASAMCKLVEKRIKVLEAERASWFCFTGRTKRKKIAMLQIIKDNLEFYPLKEAIDKVKHRHTPEEVNLLYEGRTGKVMKLLDVTFDVSLREGSIEIVDTEIKRLQKRINNFYFFTSNKVSDNTRIAALGLFIGKLKTAGYRVSDALGQMSEEHKAILEAKEAHLLDELRQIEKAVGNDLLDKKEIRHIDVPVTPIDGAELSKATDGSIVRSSAAAQSLSVAGGAVQAISAIAMTVRR